MRPDSHADCYTPNPRHRPQGNTISVNKSLFCRMMHVASGRVRRKTVRLFRIATHFTKTGNGITVFRI